MASIHDLAEVGKRSTHLTLRRSSGEIFKNRTTATETSGTGTAAGDEVAWEVVCVETGCSETLSAGCETTRTRTRAKARNRGRRGRSSGTMSICERHALDGCCC